MLLTPTQAKAAAKLLAKSDGRVEISKANTGRAVTVSSVKGVYEIGGRGVVKQVA